MMVVITIDVVRNLAIGARRFFTFTEYALLIVPCLGAPWLVREKGTSTSRSCSPTGRGSGGAACLDRASLHRGLPGARLVRLRGDAARLRGNEKDVRSLDMPRWMVVGFVPLSFLMMAIEFLRFLVRRENFSARPPARRRNRWPGRERRRCSSASASGLMMLGVPVAIAFFATNIVAAVVFMGGGAIAQIVNNGFGAMTNFALVPIPMFLLMGELFFTPDSPPSASSTPPTSCSATCAGGSPT